MTMLASRTDAPAGGSSERATERRSRISRRPAALYTSQPRRALLAEVIRQLDDAAAKRGTPISSEQLRLRLDQRSGDVQCAACRAAGVRFEPEIELREIPRAHDAVPTHADGMQLLHELATNVEDARALRPQ